MERGFEDHSVAVMQPGVWCPINSPEKRVALFPVTCAHLLSSSPSLPRNSNPGEDGKMSRGMAAFFSRRSYHLIPLSLQFGVKHLTPSQHLIKRQNRGARTGGGGEGKSATAAAAGDMWGLEKEGLTGTTRNKLMRDGRSEREGV